MEQHEQELADLYTFFQTVQFPETPIVLNKYMTIVGDPKGFVDGQIRSIESYKGSDVVRESLFKHLREFKAICENTISQS